MFTTTFWGKGRKSSKIKVSRGATDSKKVYVFAQTNSVAQMKDVKDTVRALVRIGYDGRVHKTFRGTGAKERFENEVRVLRHLEERRCDFVPRLLEADAENLKITTSNCGARVEHLDDQRIGELFAELIPYGVRHEDAFLRNITYRISDGRFCLIDFELATILEDPDGAAK